MRARFTTPLTTILGARGALLLWTLAGCQDPASIETNLCGNAVVEPENGEYCDEPGESAKCGAPGDAVAACRWICDPTAEDPGCPDDPLTNFGCGQDGVCRDHSGQFAPPVVIADTAVGGLQLIDIDGDNLLDLLATEATIDTTHPDDPWKPREAYLRLYRSTAIGQLSALAKSRLQVGGVPTVLRSGSDLAALASAVSPPAPEDTTTPVGSAVAGRLTSDGVRPILIEGPHGVPDGEIVLSAYTFPDDAPLLAGPSVFGFLGEGIWVPDADPTTDLGIAAFGSATSLIGRPSVGQPFAADDPVVADHDASRHCDVVIWAYTGADTLHAHNPCSTALEGWSAAPLELPALPAETSIGEGFVLDDADGDGLADLGITDEEGHVLVARSLGDGTFEPFAPGVGYVGHPGTDMAVIGMGDFNEDGRSDFVTASTWIRSCTLPGCGTCNLDTHRCDPSAPAFEAVPGSLADVDGDGDRELIALVRGDDGPDGAFPPSRWAELGYEVPRVGDLIVIDDPGTSAWSARFFPLGAGAELVGVGDLDRDGRADAVILNRNVPEPGIEADDYQDLVTVAFGDASDGVQPAELGEFRNIVAMHTEADEVFILNEQSDGSRLLTGVTASAPERHFVSGEELTFAVTPRRIVTGHFDVDDVTADTVAAIGEVEPLSFAVELVRPSVAAGSVDSIFDEGRRHDLTEVEVASSRWAYYAAPVAVDLDQGTQELVVLGPSGEKDKRGRVDVFTATEDGLVLTQSHPTEEPYAGPRWIAHDDSLDPPRSNGTLPVLIDFDKDGDLDVVGVTDESEPAGPRVTFFPNTGDGTLDVDHRIIRQPPLSTPGQSEGGMNTGLFSTAALAVFDDGLDRLVFVLSHAKTGGVVFRWELEPITLEFLDWEKVSEGGRPAMEMAVGDLDGDGLADIALGGEYELQVLWGIARQPEGL